MSNEIGEEEGYNIRKLIPDYCIENNLDVKEVTAMLSEYYIAVRNALNNPTKARVKLLGLGMFCLSAQKCKWMYEDELKHAEVCQKEKYKEMHYKLAERYKDALAIVEKRNAKRKEFFKNKYENYEDYTQQKIDTRRNAQQYFQKISSGEDSAPKDGDMQ